MIFSAVNSLLTSLKQNKLAKAIHPIDQTYTEDPTITGLYSQGKNLYQGRMAGATQAEQGISSSEANATAFGERNATDASQLLSYSAGIYGQGDSARVDLATKEAKDKVGRFGIYSNVSQLMNQERDKAFQDKLRKYYDDLNYKRGLEGAAQQNKAGFFSGLDDTAMAAISAFVPGGLLAGKLGGAGKTSGGASTGGGGYNPAYPI